jgi:hypothetical protein
LNGRLRLETTNEILFVTGAPGASHESFKGGSMAAKKGTRKGSKLGRSKTLGSVLNLKKK